MTNLTLISVNIGEDTDGTRTAQGCYLDSGKCPAYRGFWGRRCRHDRRGGGGYHAGEQRVLRAAATGQRVAERVGYEGLPHRNAVGDSYDADVRPDHQRTHHGGTDAHIHHADDNPHHAGTDAHYGHAYANPHHGEPYANPRHAHAHPYYGVAHGHGGHADGD